MTDLLAAALDYARRGWLVFPCEPGGKRPLGRLVRHGLHDASADPDTIRRWWTAEPRANIGLVTGVAFDVVDIDSADALDRFMTAGPAGAVEVVDGWPKCANDVEGPTVKTPRGWHCYVAATGRGNTVRVGGLGGVDWRGRGGYVVAPPSRREDGAWSWITGTPFDHGPTTPIVPAPAWVLELLARPAGKAPVPRPVAHGRGATPYGLAALEREVGRVVLAPVGRRNHTLNVAAFNLAQLVPAGHLGLEMIGDALLDAALRSGLSEGEAEATIKSGLRAGVKSPRGVAS